VLFHSSGYRDSWQEGAPNKSVRWRATKQDSIELNHIIDVHIANDWDEYEIIWEYCMKS
jgi:hypothetical protein